jgi:hypothetical protein
MPNRAKGEENKMDAPRDIPLRVWKNLDFWLNVSKIDPDRADPVIDDICRRWGI